MYNRELHVSCEIFDGAKIDNSENMSKFSYLM